MSFEIVLRVSKSSIILEVFVVISLKKKKAHNLKLNIAEELEVSDQNVEVVQPLIQISANQEGGDSHRRLVTLAGENHKPDVVGLDKCVLLVGTD